MGPRSEAATRRRDVERCSRHAAAAAGRREPAAAGGGRQHRGRHRHPRARSPRRLQFDHGRTAVPQEPPAGRGGRGAAAGRGRPRHSHASFAPALP